MALQETLDAHRSESRARWTPEVRRALEQAEAELAAAGVGAGAIGVGDRAPEFALPDQRGRPVSLSGLLERGAVVLAFFRGGW